MVWTMEIYRAFGVAPAIYEAGKPFEDDAGVVRCESLAGEWYWLVEPDQPRSWSALTAGEVNLADQNVVEPVLIDAARARGADQRFTTQLGITRTGPGVVRSFVVIVFRADLSALASRRALLWFIVNPTIGVTVLVRPPNPDGGVSAFSTTRRRSRLPTSRPSAGRSPPSWPGSPSSVRNASPPAVPFSFVPTGTSHGVSRRPRTTRRTFSPRRYIRSSVEQRQRVPPERSIRSTATPADPYE